MIYIRDYNNLSQYIPKVSAQQGTLRTDIDYELFVGKLIGVYTTTGIAYHGILVRDWPGYIRLVVQLGNRRSRYSVKAVIRKSSVVAVAYRYV